MEESHLRGTITPMGNKNAILPIIAATILTSEKVKLSNIPNISDVHVQFKILKKLGAIVKYNRKQGTAEVQVKKAKNN